MTNAFTAEDLQLTPNVVSHISVNLSFCQKNNKKVLNLVQHPQLSRVQIPDQEDRQYSIVPYS